MGSRLNGAGLLVGHLQEQQIRELLEVVAVRQSVVAQDVAVVPELVDDDLGVAHAVARVPRFVVHR